MSLCRALLLTLCVLCLPVAQSTAQSDTSRELLVSVPLQSLHQLGLTTEDTHEQLGHIRLRRAQYAALKKQGVDVRVRAVNGVLPDVFLTPYEIDTEMKRLAKTYPDRVERVNLTQRFNMPKTHEGRSLYALRLRAQRGGEDKNAPRPVVLFDSLHHARELITPMITLRAAKQLVEGFGRDEEVTAWLRQYEIWIVPVVNPDGYAYVFSDNPFWRKNRRPNPDGSFGVDLNRNYPYQWGQCGSNSDKGASEVYKGSAASSEPEIQTMIALGKALRPYLYLTYHSYGNEVVRPYMCRTSSQESMIKKICQELLFSSGYQNRTASSSGESFEHFYSQFNSFSLLIEVGDAFHPEENKIEGFLSKADETWKTMLKRGLQAGLFVGVRDKKSGAPLDATFSLAPLKHHLDDVRKTRTDGSFHMLLSPGTYTLQVKVDGYGLLSKQIEVTEKEPLRLDILLQKQGSVDDTLESVSERGAERSVDDGVMSQEEIMIETIQEASKERHKDAGYIHEGVLERDGQQEFAGCSCSGSREERPFSVVWGVLLLWGYWVSRKRKKR